MDIRRQKWIWLWLPLAVGLVTPSLVILVLDVFVGHTPVGRAVASVLARQFAPGDNLFLIAALGSIPFVILSLILLIGYRGRKDRDRLAWLSVAGTIGALALMIPAHVQVWLPLYTGGDVSSTAVIAFLVIPFLCCVTMMIGLVIGALATRSRRVQTA
jgi:hypothetical protein